MCHVLTPSNSPKSWLDIEDLENSSWLNWVSHFSLKLQKVKRGGSPRPHYQGELSSIAWLVHPLQWWTESKTSSPISMFSGSDLPHLQGLLYCAAHRRCRGHSPECCSGWGTGQLSCLCVWPQGQLFHLFQGKWVQGMGVEANICLIIFIFHAFFVLFCSD